MNTGPEGHDTALVNTHRVKHTAVLLGNWPCRLETAAEFSDSDEVLVTRMDFMGSECSLEETQSHRPDTRDRQQTRAQESPRPSSPRRPQNILSGNTHTHTHFTPNPSAYV